MIRKLKAREIEQVNGAFQGGIVYCDKAIPQCCYYPQPDGSVVVKCGEPVGVPFP